MARLSITAAIAALNAITRTVNGGTLKTFTGNAPATCEIADTGVLLGELALSSTAFPGASDGGGRAIALANAIGGDLDANADGSPGYFRVYNRSGVCQFQGTAGGPQSGQEIEFSKDTFVAGDDIRLLSFAVAVMEE